MHFSVNKLFEYLIEILPYIRVTFVYVFLSLLLGLFFGGILLFMRQSKIRILNILSIAYVNVIRCIPSVVLLFLIFYGLPMVLRHFFHMEINSSNRIVYVIVTFTLFESANCCETFRSALNAVDRGQYEAALAVGMNGFQAMKRIVIPQAMKVAVPNIGNSVMFLIKEGALAYTIGLQDIFGRGSYLSSLTYNTYNVEIYLDMFIIYWPFIMILEYIFSKIEKSLDFEKKRKELLVQK